MKKLLPLIFMMALSVTAMAQKIGLGFKLGDPTAVSAKFYLSDKFAFEVNVGGTPYHYSNGYYHKYYNNHYYDKYPGWKYVPGTLNYGGSFCIQARALAHKDINADIDGKLQWYAGGGLQYRQRSFYADFWDNNGYYYYQRRATDIDVGIDAIIGAEYTFDNAPISIFADVNLFMEVSDQFYPWFQGGIGARFNF